LVGASVHSTFPLSRWWIDATHLGPTAPGLAAIGTAITTAFWLIMSVVLGTDVATVASVGTAEAAT